MLPGLIAFVLVALAHLSGQIVAPEGVLTDVTQVLLVPTLVWVLLAGTPTPKSRLVRLVLLALVLSWLGDGLPRLVEDGSELGFGLMIVPFFLAQLAYIAAFLPFVRRSVVGNTAALAGYVLGWALFVAFCTLLGGAVWAPVVYGAVVVAMAVLATGIDRVAGIGGILFLVSDGLIGLRSFLFIELPLHGFWVMLTYALAQALLVLAVAHHARVGAPGSTRQLRPEHRGRPLQA